MAEQDPDELVVASNGDVFVADYGATLPETWDEDVEGLGFTKVGYISEDGIAFSWTPTVEEFNAWQSRSPVRRELTNHEYTATFAMEQWNGTNLGIAFGGGEVTDDGSGGYRFAFLSDVSALSEKSVIMDWNDGDKHYRAVFARASVSDTVEVALTRSSLGLLPVSFSGLDPGAEVDAFALLTDDPAFEPTGS